MDENLPRPPIDPHVDLQSFDEMPLNVVRLCNADILAETTGDEFKAAVLLWARAWHQVPAGSLPNDDRKLAYMAGWGRDLRGWKRVREGALRGFYLASDGRLYHSIVVEYALLAWSKKRTGKENAVKRWDAKQKRPRKRQVAEKPTDTGMPPHMADECHGNADPDAATDAKPMLDPIANGCSEQNRTEQSKVSPSGSYRKSRTRSRPAEPSEIEAAFDAWWVAYPRREGKGQARKAYVAALAKAGSHEVLLEGAKRYAESRAGDDPRFTKHPTTWLNGECWLDAAPAPGGYGRKADDDEQERREGIRITWQARLGEFVKRKIWHQELYGPPPGHPGCQVPTDVLEEAVRANPSAFKKTEEFPKCLI